MYIYMFSCKAYAPAVAYLSAITTLNEQYHLHTASEAQLATSANALGSEGRGSLPKRRTKDPH